MPAHRRLVQEGIDEALTTFLREHFKDRDQGTVTLTLSDLDAPFALWFRRVRADHEPQCADCKSNGVCVARQALFALTPLPDMGVSEHLRAYLLRHVDFDCVSGRGELHLPSPS